MKAPAGKRQHICWHCLKRTRTEVCFRGKPYLPGPLNRRASTNRTRHGALWRSFAGWSPAQGTLRVSVSQNLRADQGPLRVSTAARKRNDPQPRCLLSLAVHATIRSPTRVLDGQLLVPHKRMIDCARRSGPGSINNESQCCVELWSWSFGSPRRLRQVPHVTSPFPAGALCSPRASVNLHFGISL